mgnify:CR=1 FL=1
MVKRDASVAVIGAGDYIGSADRAPLRARRLRGVRGAPGRREAAGAHRRRSRPRADGASGAVSMHARRTTSRPSSARPTPTRRSRSASSTSAPTSTSRSSTRPSASSARCGRWPATRAFWPGARPRAPCSPHGRGSLFFTGATASLRAVDGLCRVRGGEGRSPGGRAEHGARARAEEHPRRAPRDRRRRRHRVRTRPHPRRAGARRRSPRSPRTS